MPPKSNEADLIRVKHIIDAVTEALSFIKKKTRSDLNRDRKLVLSLVKEIEIVGEAASKIRPEFKKKYSNIPWGLMVRTRNRLIHGYFDVNKDIVWNTVEDDFPPLIEKLRNIIKANSS